MGGEDAEYLRAQAGLRDKAEKRDGATQSLLDRFGGRYVFDRIRKELISEGMYPGEASQQAARRIQFYEKRAQSESTPDRRETIDTIYLRDEYRRKQGIAANLVTEEGRRMEDEDVQRRLRELMIPTPSRKH